jgi:general secretion pathway protein F
VFEFQAIDVRGQTETGVLQADTARGARARLRERGLAPLVVSAVAAGSGRRRWGARSAATTLATRQLATLLQAGLPLDEALAALAEGAGGRLRPLALALRDRVMAGAPLSLAMAEFPQEFDALYQATVSAGERSGRLDAALLRLADHLEQRDATRHQLLVALAYPVLLVLVAIVVVTGLMAFVVPELVAVFLRSGQPLPWPTRALLVIGEGVRSFGGWGLLAFAAVVALLAATWRQPAFRAWRDARWLALPGLGRWLRTRDASRYSRTLAMMLASAVPLLDALSLSANTVRNTVWRSALDAAAARVREGVPLARALADVPGFPPVALRLVASGERAGRLDALLDEAAAQLERELALRTSLMLAALGPAVILLVGGLVLFIVLAILLPVFDMNQLLR